MPYVAVGTYDQNKAGHEEHYYVQRYCFMDYRGLMKISPLSYWGYEVMTMTASHQLLNGQFQATMVLKPVIVEDYAWIASRSTLYNCTIGHHAIVSIGSVVSGMVVEPYTVVEGNPAQIIAKWDGKRWLTRKMMGLP